MTAEQCQPLNLKTTLHLIMKMSNRPKRIFASDLFYRIIKKAIATKRFKKKIYNLFPSAKSKAIVTTKFDTEGKHPNEALY